MSERPVMTNKNSFLGTENIGKLIIKFAVPAVLSMLVNALYNIADQIFIGQSVGMLGNAATNVAFPLTTIATSIALLLGIGTASNFNLEMGKGNNERAEHIACNGLSYLMISGVVLFLISLIFLKPLIVFFGATEQVIPYAYTYTGITVLGMPFFIFNVGGSHIIRADGSPKYAMASTITGALINVVLDYIFIFKFNMGIAGAAWATIIGQFISSLLTFRYLYRFKSIKISLTKMKPKLTYLKVIASLGMASCFNQLAMTVVQITLNNTLRFYGESSIYGSDIPLACVGVISKVNILFLAFAIGIAQGCQPIIGFNYGAKNFNRVKETYFKAITTITCISIAAFLCFQFYPRQIVGVFGSGSETYFEFAEKYFKIYMFMTFANGIQPVTANFFTSIGKAKKGIFISMTRQIIFLLPLILIIPRFLGIEGVMYAGPMADFAAAILSSVLVIKEMTLMKNEESIIKLI